MTGHTGHHDLSVIQPQHNLSSSSDSWQNPFVQQTKYSTYQVPHGNDHSTHILHSTLGYASVLCKKDGYQSYSPVITNKSSIPIPAYLNNLIHPAQDHKLKKMKKNHTHTYPKASFLVCQASACCDYVQPLQQQFSWEQNKA